MRSYLPLKHALGVGVLACVGAASLASAATTAVTDPVGFTTLSASNKSSSAGQFNYLSLNLTRPIAFQAAIPSGGVTTDGTGHTVLTFASGTFTAGQFSAPSYLEIGSGGNAGAVSDIIASTTNSVTLADNITSAASTPVGNTVKIRPQWTFATAFGTPNASDPAAITGGTSGTDPNADILSLVDSSTNTTVDYYYNTTDVKWERAATNADASNDVIPIYAGIQFQRRSTTAANITLVGAVKLGTTGIWVNGSSADTTSLVSNPFPLPSKRLDQLQLYTGDPNTGIAGGDANTADLLRILDPQTGIVTDFYYDNATASSGTRWKSGFSDASLFVIPAGASAQVVRKAGRGSFVWYAPQPSMALDPNAATPALTLVSAVSRKAHGLAMMDVNLPLDGSLGIEDRVSGGNHTIVFEFSNNITAATASVSSGAGATGQVSYSGRFVTVPVSGVSDMQRLTVSLSGVVDSYGQITSGSATAGFLAGDVDGSSLNPGFVSRVNVIDMQGIKANLATPISFSNFRADANLSNTINVIDMQVVKGDLSNLIQ